jgi:hypothetical protein
MPTFFLRSPLNSLVVRIAVVLIFAGAVNLAVASAASAVDTGPNGVALVTTTAAPPLDPAAVWPLSAALSLDWDFTNGKPAAEPTRVQIVADTKELYVRFEVVQHEPIVSSQHVNDNGDGSDDEVSVYLWPSGGSGFRYQFSTTPNGTHYQYSTENGIYAPTWTSNGRTTPGGYVVTMAIPLGALRADGRKEWLAQFTRFTQRAGAVDEWTHGNGQSTPSASVFAGRITGFTMAHAKPQPRIGVYALGEAGSSSVGGSTSRTGADISLPITATSSFVATIHPDFSNVEVDQQTIAPTTFARVYNEVRPFFSQSAANIYSGNCSGCPYISELYTPSIPTPRDGYAVEGIQGPITFGAFDAVGTGRNDSAETISYLTPNHHFNLWETQVDANLPGLHDDTQLVAGSYDTNTDYRAYFDYGSDSGTQVLDGSNAQRYDGGVAYYGKDDYSSFTMRKIGEYYNPYDGLISLTDIAGYSGQINHTFQFGPAKPIQSFAFSAFIDHYDATTGGTDLTDGTLSGSVTTKTKFTLGATSGFSYVRLPGDLLRPANQQGVTVQYQSGTALQDQFVDTFGRFGDGRLVTLDRDVAFRFMRLSTITLNADSTDWRGDSGVRAVQWLERLGVAVDMGPRSALTVGLRKITGAPPPFGALPAPVLGTNVSLGYSVRRPHDELYLVYGDASQFSTRPALTFKLIHYFGAEKGT